MAPDGPTPLSIAQGAGLCVGPDQHDVAVFWLADRKTIAQDIVFL
jgi:hypothetical protein